MASPTRPPTKRQESAHPSAVLEERQRLARMLHDTVCQELTAICFLASAAAHQHGARGTDAGRKFEEIADLVQRAGASLAEIVHGLNSRP